MRRFKGYAVGVVAAVLFLAGYAVIFMPGPSNLSHLLDHVVAGYLGAWGLYAMLSELPRKEIGQRFIVMTMTIGACILLTESAAVLRVVDYRTVFNTFDGQTILANPGRMFDRELLWLHEPYYRFEADYQGNIGRGLCLPPDPSRRVTVQYDRNGFRNSADLDRADIVVIGDSYIESPMIVEESLSTTVLAKLQGRTVANLGNSGYGPQQELAVLKRFGLPLRPKAVVWAFFEGNDLHEMKQYPGTVAKMAGQPAAWHDFWYRSFSRNLLALYFRPVTSTCVPSSRLEPYWAKFIDREKSVSPVFFSPPDVGGVTSDANMFQAATYIAEAARLCRERHIRFIVVFVPEKYRVYHDLGNVRLMTDDVRSMGVNDVPHYLRRLLAELSPDTQYVDLSAALKAESRKGVATYLPDDTHWTADGHRVVAEEIHRALSAMHGTYGRQDM